MGVPRFFRYISETHSNVIKQISMSQKVPAIDNFYIDTNGIIHNCSQSVYFSEKALRAGKKPALKHFFNVIFGYIDNLVNFVKPQQLVYIAIDGVAPMAKQSQQRQRRYKASFEKDPKMTAIFDSTSITPGTFLMYQLGKYLELVIRNKMMTDPIWSNLKVIVSSSNVPGEGEHKIVNYIRTLKDNNIIHCMYGLDADLFMLSLRTHKEHFYLLREDQFVKSKIEYFFLVDIGLLRTELFNKYKFADNDMIRTIDDFVFLSFLIGNDFLHAMPCLDGEDVGLNFDYMCQKRKQIGEYLTDGKKLNFKSLFKLFKAMQIDENNILLKKYFSKSGFPNSCLQGTLIDDRKPEKGIDYEKYRTKYYKKAGISGNEQIYQFCDYYIKTLDWVNSYYYERPMNWKWMYPFHYTPLLKDLLIYMKTTVKFTRITNDFEPPLSPFEQLLCVVPPLNYKLVPSHLQHIYFIKELQQYYPNEFKIDLDGKLKEWEGIALLPFVNVKEIQTAYQYAIDTASQSGINTNSSRNKVEQNILFQKNLATRGYTFKNEYGEITACKITFKYF